MNLETSIQSEYLFYSYPIRKFVSFIANDNICSLIPNQNISFIWFQLEYWYHYPIMISVSLVSNQSICFNIIQSEYLFHYHYLVMFEHKNAIYYLLVIFLIFEYLFVHIWTDLYKLKIILSSSLEYFIL